MSDGSDNGSDSMYPGNGGSDPTYSNDGGTVREPDAPHQTLSGRGDGSADMGRSDSSTSLPIELGLGGKKSFIDVSTSSDAGLTVDVGGKCLGAIVDLDAKGDAQSGLIGVGELSHLGGLVGDKGSLIDVDFGQGDGHTAALLDVVVGGDDIAKASLLGSEILSGGDGIGVCGLLDGLFDDCSLLS